jgi:hypothetical protein
LNLKTQVGPNCSADNLDAIAHSVAVWKTGGEVSAGSVQPNMRSGAQKAYSKTVAHGGIKKRLKTLAFWRATGAKIFIF